jgi:hypothetical protein
MILRQFLHTEPVAASYVFGCGGKATGAVVDPVGDLARYLRTAEETVMRIRYVIDTHLHADHVSTARELAKAAGAEYVLFADANVTFSFRKVRDGDLLELGNVKALPDYLEIWPGAYSGSVCGRSLSGKPTSTIGFEKRFNKALRIEDESAFLRTMLADIPPAPSQAAQVRAVNSGLMAAE